MAIFTQLATLALSASLFASNAEALTKSSGCGKASPAGIKSGGTGSSNKLDFTTTSGVKRSYLLHIPTGYAKSSAQGIIFSFHGRGQNGAMQETLSQFSNHTVNPDLLAVYPDGISAEWQGDPEAQTDDVAFTLELLKDIESKYCVDTDKIYAAGMSNGGGFSANVLACDIVASTLFAAFAGVSGAYYQGTSDANCDTGTVPIKCNPGRKPVPIIEFHGTSDATIPYKGGARRSRCLPSIPHFVSAWAERNGLSTKNTSTALSSGNIRYDFGTGDLSGVVRHFRVFNGAHEWGSPSLHPSPKHIMNFFSKWTLATTPIDKVSGTSTTASATSSKSTSLSKSSTTHSKSTSSKSTSKSSSSSTKASSTKSSAGGARPTSYAPSPMCPAANGTVFTTDSHSYRVLCSYDTINYVLNSPGNVGSFGACIAACDTTDLCEHAVFNGACYLKKAVKGFVPKRMGDATKVSYRLG